MSMTLDSASPRERLMICVVTLGMEEVGVSLCCVIVLLCCFGAGVNHCKLFKGRCCSLVNDLINILIEYGEIKPNEEVNIIYRLLSISHC